MIEVKSLYHQYPGNDQPAVSNVSFRIGEGEIFGFLGPSGSGKSTVQNIMTKLLPLQRGEVLYNGVNLPRLGRAFFNQVGVSFEHPNLYLKLTGLENLQFHAGLYQGETEDPAKLLASVGLGEAANKPAGAYSKGMKQRLVFARSLINRPKILFLDEPTSGLDPGTAKTIKDIIREKQSRGATIFLTTHNMLVADDLCNQIAFLNDGAIVAMDTPRSLKLKYGEKSVRAEYRVDGQLQSEVLFLEHEEDRNRLKELVDGGQVETLHTMEATLEQVFIKLTGRGLA